MTFLDKQRQECIDKYLEIIHELKGVDNERAVYILSKLALSFYAERSEQEWNLSKGYLLNRKDLLELYQKHIQQLQASLKTAEEASKLLTAMENTARMIKNQEQLNAGPA